MVAINVTPVLLEMSIAKKRSNNKFGRLQFQLLTICQQLASAFFFQPLFQLCPVITRTSLVRLICQNGYHIHD